MTSSPHPDRADSADLVRGELENGLHELELVEFTVEHQLRDGALDAVAWTYVGKPHPDAQFLGVRLHQPLTLRGVTLVQASPEEGTRSALVHRLAGRPQPGRPECRLSTRL